MITGTRPNLTKQELEYMSGQLIIAGSKIYTYCNKCGKLVRINKPIFGGIHICALPKGYYA